MHVQLDPVGGLAGDMFVAAMLDAFPALDVVVQGAVRAAGLPERFRCELRKHADHALTGKRFLVREASPDHDHGEHPTGLDHAKDHQHGHRAFAEIRAGLASSSLEPGVCAVAIAIFTILAEAEAQVHGATADTVTFHELGEWDSIADIVAAAAIIYALENATWSVGPLPLGSGFVKSAHGLLPVPAPATALLLRGLAVRDDGLEGERVTPTGAAIGRYLLSLPGEAPRVRTMLGVGLGFGMRLLPGISNCLRVLAFESASPNAGHHDRVTSIEFEVDDQTPEDLAIGLDHVRVHPGVLDVLQTPAFGKKGRLVICVRVLCRAEAEEDVVRECFLETTTLGLRLVEVSRHTLSRTRDTVDAGGHPVERKFAKRGTQVTSKVEAESLREVAGHHERERLRRAARDE
jgi:uncharacterized protein (TIGR00299 family) protein